jgi:hypothetical protein
MQPLARPAVDAPCIPSPMLQTWLGGWAFKTAPLPLRLARPAATHAMIFAMYMGLLGRTNVRSRVTAFCLNPRPIPPRSSWMCHRGPHDGASRSRGARPCMPCVVACICVGTADWKAGGMGGFLGSPPPSLVRMNVTGRAPSRSSARGTRWRSLPAAVRPH